MKTIILFSILICATATAAVDSYIVRDVKAQVIAKALVEVGVIGFGGIDYLNMKTASISCQYDTHQTPRPAVCVVQYPQNIRTPITVHNAAANVLIGALEDGLVESKGAYGDCAMGKCSIEVASVSCLSNYYYPLMCTVTFLPAK